MAKHRKDSNNEPVRREAPDLFVGFTSHTKEGIEFSMGNEHRLRFYLAQVRYEILNKEMPDEQRFKPSYLVTAVKLPTGVIELAINTESIIDKIDYILNAYDENMRLKTNPVISMINVMVV